MGLINENLPKESALNIIKAESKMIKKAPITLKLNKKSAYSLNELSVCVFNSFFMMAAPAVFITAYRLQAKIIFMIWGIF